MSSLIAYIKSDGLSTLLATEVPTVDHSSCAILFALHIVFATVIILAWEPSSNAHLLH